MTKPKVRDLLERKGDPLQLEALTGEVGLDREIPTAEASSPGLVLAGYTQRFAAHRLHVLGETEVTYLASLDAAARRRALETMFRFDLPCVVISKGQEPPAELLELARGKGVAVIRTRLKTAELYRRYHAQGLEIVRGLTGIDFVGFDVVEVIPGFDPGGVTATLAANLAYEMVSLAALRRVRREGQGT